MSETFTEQPITDPDQVGAAMSHLLSDLAASASTVLVAVGLRTGLWDALAERRGGRRGRREAGRRRCPVRPRLAAFPDRCRLSHLRPFDRSLRPGRRLRRGPVRAAAGAQRRQLHPARRVVGNGGPIRRSVPFRCRHLLGRPAADPRRSDGLDQQDVVIPPPGRRVAARGRRAHRASWRRVAASPTSAAATAPPRSPSRRHSRRRTAPESTSTTRRSPGRGPPRPAPVLPTG